MTINVAIFVVAFAFSVYGQCRHRIRARMPTGVRDMQIRQLHMHKVLTDHHDALLAHRPTFVDCIVPVQEAAHKDEHADKSQPVSIKHSMIVSHMQHAGSRYIRRASRQSVRSKAC